MSKGAGCDCEIFMNGWSLRRQFQVYDPKPRNTNTPGGARLQGGASRFNSAVWFVDCPGQAVVVGGRQSAAVKNCRLTRGQARGQ
jgi:hypothetical protein